MSEENPSVGPHPLLTPTPARPVLPPANKHYLGPGVTQQPPEEGRQGGRERERRKGAGIHRGREGETTETRDRER